MDVQKVVVYQLLPRLFGNKNTDVVIDGSREENGCGKFNDITLEVLAELKKMGITHVWYTGVIEHALVQGYPDNGIPDGNPLVIKGKAGSPYAIKDYYDVNPDLAEDVDQRLEEFGNLVERTHKTGLKVIIDFVPNHLAREYSSDKKPEGIDDFGVGDDKSKAFDNQNNFYYIPDQKLELSEDIKARYPESHYNELVARATGNDQFTNQPGINDWFETVKLNYGVDYKSKKNHFDQLPDTWLKMRDVLKYWTVKGVDGFRCDMAEMVPVEFWKWVIPQLKQIEPWLTFTAEVYNPALYKLYIHEGQFDYLYDKVGLYDTLRGVVEGHRTAKDISACWQNLQGIDKHMLRFMENHDEQRIASRFFASDPKLAIPAMAVSAFMHQGPLMIYNGQEVREKAEGVSGFSGDDGRTTIFDYWHMPEHQKWMNNGMFDGARLSDEQKALRDEYVKIVHLCQQPAIVQGLFYDLMWQNNDMGLFDANKLYTFLRYTNSQQLLVVCNFSSERQHIHLKIPSAALQILDIPRPILIDFADLQGVFQSSIGSEELISKGLKMVVSPLSYFVLEINY